MNSLKHYHLGCGESLRSHLWELCKLNTTDFVTVEKLKRKSAVTTKKTKSH